MTKKELKQLAYLKNEIEMLEEQIDDAQRKIDGFSVHDSVIASYPQFPFTQHNVSLAGIPVEDYSSVWPLKDELTDLKSLLQSKKVEREREYNRLNRYIQDVDDSLIRQIMTYKYIDNLPWEQVAVHINDNYSGDQVRIMLDRFLIKN